MDLDVGTRAILKLALLPPGGLLLLLLIGWLFARRFFGRFLILLGIAGIYFLSTPGGLNLLAAQLETVPALTPAQARSSGAGAILVFLADVRRHNPEFGGADAPGAMSLQRLDYALSLHRETGLPIILSGGSPKGDTTPLAQLGSEWLHRQADVSALAADNRSRDTHENAQYSAALLQSGDIGKVLLVTHAYHMPRALLSATAAGIDAVAAPFGFEHVSPKLPNTVGFKDWLPRPGYLGRSYLILHEMTGLVWYGLNQR